MSAEIKVIKNDSKLEEILNSEYLRERSHYIEVGPEKIIMPGKYEKYYERIKNFEIRDEDVFIMAFPKTGSRWTQEMVWLILNNLDFETAHEVLLDERSIQLEVETLFDEFPFNVLDTLEMLKSPRCIKSHLHWTLLPKAITSGAKKPKIIAVLRGPEDTCTSHYYQSKIVEGYSGSWEQYCDLFLGGKVPLGPYWKHVLGFWEQRHRPNIMFVRYNKMKADLAGTIRDVALFLGKNLTDNEVLQMCEHLSFDNLKRSKGFNVENFLVTRKAEVNPFMRKGQVGDHKNAMTPEVIEAFKKQREEQLKGTELTFD